MSTTTKSPASEGFVQVHQYSNWCEYDCYGPPVKKNGCHDSCDEIKDGDEIVVRFPDGAEIPAVAEVVKSSYEISDMGSPYTVPTRTAFAVYSLHGASVRIPLRNKDLWVKKT